MKRTMILTALLCALTFQAPATNRMVTELNSLPEKSATFKPGGEWFPYPAYSDRDAWDALSKDFKAQVGRIGKKYKDYQWQLQRASSYLEYEKTGNRELMRPEENNRSALSALVLAELVEGKGTYLNQIVDGVWFLCQQYSWAHGQHTSMQDSRRTLPTYEDAVISLHGAATGTAIAIAWHFFHEEFDKMDPSISRTVLREIKRQITDPYLNESKDKNHWWNGFTGDTKHHVNNWNPFCNMYALTATLLTEPDQERISKAVERCCKSVDIYLDNVKQDGACDEGPGYWGMSCGTVFDILSVLNEASYGKFNIFDDPLIRKMGEFKAKTYFGDGWVMNYGDGAPRDLGDKGRLYRYGKCCESKELTNFAISLLANGEKQKFDTPSLTPTALAGGVYGCLETIKYNDTLKADEKEALKLTGGDVEALKHLLVKDLTSVSYPLTEYGILRKDGWVIAAKGGNNHESHNHNDVGSFILMNDEMPVLVDPGVGAYRKETFSPKRYTIWTMQSDWHNLPVINGCSQKDGAEFKAKGTSIDIAGGIFVSDISGAYPESAGCSTWKRNCTLTGKGLVLTDTYSLDKRNAPDEEHFIVRGSVEQKKDGEIIITTWDFKNTKTAQFKLEYPKSLKPQIEEKELKDSRLSRPWGDKLVRISLISSANAPVSGTYTIKITKK